MAFFLLLSSTTVLAAGSILYLLLRNKKRQETLQKKIYPFKIIKKLPGSAAPDKRTVAVLGATGFVGSEVVDQLIKDGEYRVCMLGRRFNDGNTNPKADGVYQVDMMRKESLENAFHGADTVVFTAISIPTVFSSAEELLKFNVTGAENVLNAARKMGVRNIILIAGINFEEESKDAGARALVDAFNEIADMFVQANQYHSISTCVLRFGQIYGASSPLYQSILKGEVGYFPLLEKYATFVPVETVAEAVVKAEKKLNEDDSLVCGQVINITGPSSTIKEFLTHPSLGVKIRHVPSIAVKMMAGLNQLVARVTGYAPLGYLLSSTMASFFDLNEERYDPTLYQEALDMDEAPPLNQGIPNMVAKHHNTQQKQN